MTNAAKFVKTSNFHTLMGLFPVLRSKGRGSSISFPRVVAVFIRPEHQIHLPSCLQSKISLVRSTLRIKSQ